MTAKVPPPGARKPAIVTTTSRQRGKLLRTERAVEPDDPDIGGWPVGLADSWASPAVGLVRPAT
jgi:hypothetical protein